MNYLEDFIYVQSLAIKNTFKNIRYFFIVAASIIVGTLAINVVSNVLNNTIGVGVLSIVVGVIIYILKIFVLSFIMNILYKAVRENGNVRGIINDDKSQFMVRIIQIAFIFYVVRLLMQFGGLNRLYYYLMPILLILFNALPESIYLDNYDSTSTLLNSIEFLKNNIINWALPNLLIFLLFKLIGIPYLLPFNIYLSTDIMQMAFLIIIVLAYSIFLIYRGNLYDILNGSSMRKRDYMRKFN